MIPIFAMIKTISKNYLPVKNKSNRETQKNGVVNKKNHKMIIEEIQNQEKEENVKEVIKIAHHLVIEINIAKVIQEISMKIVIVTEIAVINMENQVIEHIIQINLRIEVGHLKKVNHLEIGIIIEEVIQKKGMIVVREQVVIKMLSKVVQKEKEMK